MYESDQYCQRQRCKHVEFEQFWYAFASRRFVSDSWAFLLFVCCFVVVIDCDCIFTYYRLVFYRVVGAT